MTPRNDLVGKRFDHLVVIAYSHQMKHTSYWTCQCDCGSIVIKGGRTMAHEHKLGKVQSCGCVRSPTKRNGHGLTPELVGRNTYYSRYKHDSRARGHSFEIDLETFGELTSKCCFYCGQPPRNIPLGKEVIYLGNGLDRKDSFKGYTIDNVVPCCKNCNFAKQKLSQEEYIDLCIRVVKHQEVSNGEGE